MRRAIIAEPTPYFHKRPMRFRDYEIYYNRDSNVTHILSNRHDYYELYFLVAGKVSYYVDARLYELEPGDVILIPPGVQHEARIETEWGDPYERYVLWLDKPFLERLSSMRSDLMAPFDKTLLGQAALRPSADLRQEIRRHLQSIYLDSQSDAFAADLLGIADIIQLLVKISRAKLFQGENKHFIPEPQVVDSGKNQLLYEVLSYIERHITEPIRIEDLVARFYISRSYLSKCFSEEIGVGLAAFIRKKRFYLMRQALEHGHSIKSILEQFQFTSYSSFYRGFKAEFGIGPQEFLDQLRKEND